eukprot:5203254-Prymnesium_polylepis.2
MQRRRTRAPGHPLQNCCPQAGLDSAVVAGAVAARAAIGPWGSRAVTEGAKTMCEAVPLPADAAGAARSLRPRRSPFPGRRCL